MLSALISDHDINIDTIKHEISWSQMNDTEKTMAKETLSHIADNKFKYIRYNGIIYL